MKPAVAVRRKRWMWMRQHELLMSAKLGLMLWGVTERDIFRVYVKPLAGSRE